MRNLSARSVLTVVAALLCLAAGVVYVVSVIQHESAASAQQGQISSLQQQIQRATAARNAEMQRRADAQKAQAIKDQLGVDPSRIDDDRPAIEKLAGTALNWDSNASYVKARESLKRQYGLSENDEFMKTFMPKPIVTKDSSGHEYPYIDSAGLNSSMDDVRLKILTAKGQQVTYLVLADFTTTDGDTDAQSTAILQLTTDAQGHISNVSGQSAEAQVRKSG